MPHLDPVNIIGPMPAAATLDPFAPAPADDPVKAERLRIVTEICADIADGSRVNDACEKHGITWRKLWGWKEADTELQAMFARARSNSGITWADKASKAVSDDLKVPDGQEVAAQRLRADHYTWRAKVSSPREFGEKIDVTTDGGALGSAVVILPALDPLPMPGPDSVQYLDPDGTGAGVVVLGHRAAARLLGAQLRAIKAGEPIPSIDRSST